MPELTDSDILEIIGFLPGFTGTDDAARSIASMRQAMTYLPEHPHCSIDAVVPFVTALATVLTTMPKWDGELPLNCHLSEGWVRQSRIAEVAGEVMAMTERCGVGSHGARMAVDMALTWDWLQANPSACSADPFGPGVRPTIAGRQRCSVMPPAASAVPFLPGPVALATGEPNTTPARDPAKTLSTHTSAIITPPSRHPPVVHRNGLILLKVLASVAKPMLRVDIAMASAEINGLKGEKAVGKRLADLMIAGLVETPHGARSGYAITDAGRDRLANVQRITD